MSTSFAAIVVAAGSGTRFGADRPKALLELGGRSLVRRAADAMVAAGCSDLVVVIPDGWQVAFAAALEGLPAVTVAGGLERTDSVRRGLAALSADLNPVTLITDAARPLVPRAVVERVVRAVGAGTPVVIPAVPVTDTIRELASEPNSASRMLDRSRLRAVQTPQGFDTAVLMDAYGRLGDEVVTDDAGVCERVGYRVQIVDGAVESVKITYPSDLRLAELMIADREGV